MPPPHAAKKTVFPAGMAFLRISLEINPLNRPKAIPAKRQIRLDSVTL